MTEKTSSVKHNLLAGIAILAAALLLGQARAADLRGGQFLPLGQKTATAGVSTRDGQQFFSLRGQSRSEAARPMMALNGGKSGRTWKLADLRETPRIPKAKDVPDEVKLAMATGYMPRADADAPLPHAGERREMIAAALAPVIAAHEGAEAEDIDTDIEDAHAALAASLPAAAHELVDTALGYVWPVADAHYAISSGYGYRKHPITGKRAFHAGIDIPAPAGTDVLAAIGGEVTGVGEHPRLGRYVKVSHADGTYSLYGHLQKWLAKYGAQVKAGDIIGKVGSTGRSTGPHLDFSIRRGGKPFDPMSVLAGALEQKKLALNE